MSDSLSDQAQTSVHDAWESGDHVSAFSVPDSYSNSRLIKYCDQFNECQLFRTLVGTRGCLTVLDVGCATGWLYRYFRNVWPALEYKGLDVSQSATDYAKGLYPSGNFRVFNGDLKSVPDAESDIVFCRDVVHHQANPRELLGDLYHIAKKYLILRMRTMEEGATVFDVAQSCQYTYGHWVPFIVFNTSELIDTLQSFRPSPASIILRRHPTILGGQSSRYLPKELYYPETGTAETALLIEKGEDTKGNRSPTVSIQTCPETRGLDRRTWLRWMRAAAERWRL